MYRLACRCVLAARRSRRGRQEILKALRFLLTPTCAQEADLHRYTNAARWPSNHTLAATVVTHERWRVQVTTLMEIGIAESIVHK